jgi:hypothetical protein
VLLKELTELFCSPAPHQQQPAVEKRYFHVRGASCARQRQLINDAFGRALGGGMRHEVKLRALRGVSNSLHWSSRLGDLLISGFGVHCTITITILADPSEIATLFKLSQASTKR